MKITLVKGIKIGSNVCQFDYESLENLPNLDTKQNELSDTDGSYGQRVKAIEDALASAIDFNAQTY